MTRPHYKVIYREAFDRFLASLPPESRGYFSHNPSPEIVRFALQLEREGWAPEVSPELQKAREKYASIYPKLREEALGGERDSSEGMQLLVRLMNE
jgi:hypothetical protein